MKIQQPVFVSDKGEEGNQKVPTKQSKTEMKISVLSIGGHRSGYCQTSWRSKSCG